MDVKPVLFLILAGLTGISAIAVVVTQNIVRSAAWLLFTLAGTAGIYFLIGADFIGAAQLIVYVGGILVLVVFGVMLTAQGPFTNLKTGAAEWAVAMLVGILLFSMIAVSTLSASWPQRSEVDLKRMDKENTDQRSLNSVEIGMALEGLKQVEENPALTEQPHAELPVRRTQIGYLLPFEIVSIHLVVVLIGAAYLARAKRRRSTTT